MITHPIETAPTNQRIIVFQDGPPPADEMAIAWLDRIDGQFYYAPQGGILSWKPSHWMALPNTAQAAPETAINRLKDISFIAREAYPVNNGTWEGMVKMMGRLADEGLSSVSSAHREGLTIPNILIDHQGNDIYTPEEIGLSSTGPVPTRNSTVLASFVEHCRTHPTERFWQALRNWCGRSFILASSPNNCLLPTTLAQGDVEDTFNWEGKDK